MRNDSARWDAPVDVGTRLTFDGLTLALTPVPHMTLMSGPRVLAKFPDAIGWPTAASGSAYRVCLRRDRIIEVGHPERPDGWDSAQGWAVSDITSGTSLIDLTGPESLRLFRSVMDISEDTPSRAASRLVLGREIVAYRYGPQDSYRIHVKRAETTGLWTALNRSAACLA